MPEEVYEAAMGRLTYDFSKAASTTNPGGTRHWHIRKIREYEATGEFRSQVDDVHSR